MDREIGPYWVIEEIAKDSPGNVLKGVHKRLEREVAIWELGATLLSEPSARRVLAGAVEILKEGGQGCPGKISIFEAGVGGFYLVSEIKSHPEDGTVRKVSAVLGKALAEAAAGRYGNAEELAAALAAAAVPTRNQADEALEEPWPHLTFPGRSVPWSLLFGLMLVPLFFIALTFAPARAPLHPQHAPGEEAPPPAAGVRAGKVAPGTPAEGEKKVQKPDRKGETKEKSPGMGRRKEASLLPLTR